jgi:type II secretory pathway pseudopilin PulG
MSLLAIIAIVLIALLILLFIGGLIAARRRARATENQLREHVAAADRALEAARAADRGWDPVLMEEAARLALERGQPGFHYDKLHLVLVDDRPGTEADRAEFVAAGDAGVARVAVIRRGESWIAEIIA